MRLHPDPDFCAATRPPSSKELLDYLGREAAFLVRGYEEWISNKTFARHPVNPAELRLWREYKLREFETHLRCLVAAMREDD